MDFGGAVGVLLGRCPWSVRSMAGSGVLAWQNVPYYRETDLSTCTCKWPLYGNTGWPDSRFQILRFRHPFPCTMIGIAMPWALQGAAALPSLREDHSAM